MKTEKELEKLVKEAEELEEKNREEIEIYLDYRSGKIKTISEQDKWKSNDGYFAVRKAAAKWLEAEQYEKSLELYERTNDPKELVKAFYDFEDTGQKLISERIRKKLMEDYESNPDRFYSCRHNFANICVKTGELDKAYIIYDQLWKKEIRTLNMVDLHGDPYSTKEDVDFYLHKSTEVREEIQKRGGKVPKCDPLTEIEEAKLDSITDYGG